VRRNKVHPKYKVTENVDSPEGTDEVFKDTQTDEEKMIIDFDSLVDQLDEMYSIVTENKQSNISKFFMLCSEMAPNWV